MKTFILILWVCICVVFALPDDPPKVKKDSTKNVNKELTLQQLKMDSILLKKDSIRKK
jgi:hypothetical protein